MTGEELRSIKRSKHLKEKMANNRAHIFRETGMISGDENYYLCLLRNNEIEELSDSYSYLLLIDDLIQKIGKDSTGFYYIEDSAIMEYKNHPQFYKVAGRILDTIMERNMEIDSNWDYSSLIQKYRFDYWDSISEDLDNHNTKRA